MMADSTYNHHESSTCEVSSTNALSWRSTSALVGRAPGSRCQHRRKSSLRVEGVLWPIGGRPPIVHTCSTNSDRSIAVYGEWKKGTCRVIISCTTSRHRNARLVNHLHGKETLSVQPCASYLRSRQARESRHPYWACTLVPPRRGPRVGSSWL